MFRIASVRPIDGGGYRLTVESSGGGVFTIEYWPAEGRLVTGTVIKHQDSLGLPDES